MNKCAHVYAAGEAVQNAVQLSDAASQINDTVFEAERKPAVATVKKEENTLTRGTVDATSSKSPAPVHPQHLILANGLVSQTRYDEALSGDRNFCYWAARPGEGRGKFLAATTSYESLYEM